MNKEIELKLCGVSGLASEMLIALLALVSIFVAFDIICCAALCVGTTTEHLFLSPYNKNTLFFFNCKSLAFCCALEEYLVKVSSLKNPSFFLALVYATYSRFALALTPKPFLHSLLVTVKDNKYKHSQPPIP